MQDLKRREDEEATKFNKRIEDRKIIVEQIEERKRSQLLAAEARAQENETMRNLMAKYAAEDAVQAMRRKQQVENSRVEVLQANEDAINRKRNNKLEAQQEMECILEYQRKRDAELKRREDEEAFIERAKVARQAQLLAEQERVINNADKRDEILARRFAEQKDRCERQKEAEAKRKRLDDARLLMQSRERAAEQKKRLAAELQKLEMDETNHMASQLEKLHMEERLASEEKRQRDMLFRDFLLEQAAESKTKRQLDRGRKYSEGADARHAEKDELAKLNELRSAMVKELSDQGVDPRFLAEIKAVNIEKLLQQV